MMARDRQFGKSHRTTLRSRVAIAAAVLAGGGAIAAGAVVATSNHGAAPAKVQSAGYSQSYTSGWNTLNSTLNNWGSSRQYSYSLLGRLSQAQTFTQYWHNNKMLAVQRGIVVLATNKFIILQSANGKLHLWLVSGHTAFQNVSTTRSGMTALTASTSAANQAMTAGNMVPATTMLAGAPTTAAALLTPTTRPVTVTVQVANTALTVTVTVTRSTATVNQTGTTPWTGMPSMWQNTWTQNAWMTARTIRRGDLATIVGFRKNWILHAQLVLFAPLTTSDVGGKAFTGTNTNTGQATYGFHS
jgi:ribosomal protein S11